MALLKAAGISISTNPHISLVAQGRYDQEPIRRGVTRAKDLWRLGVNVFSSQDDVNDPYYPFGRNDQQEVAAYVCHTCHMTYPDEILAVYDFVTHNAAKALRLDGYGRRTGLPGRPQCPRGPDVAACPAAATAAACRHPRRPGAGAQRADAADRARRLRSGQQKLIVGKVGAFLAAEELHQILHRHRRALRPADIQGHMALMQHDGALP